MSLHNPHFAELDSLVDHLNGLNYRDRRRALWREVRPRPSRFLYKFRSLIPADDTSVDRLRDILVHSRLWLSSPVDFNDPFDMSVKLVVEGTPKQKRECFEDLLERQGRNWTHRRKQIPQFMRRTNAEVAAIVQAAHQEQVKSAGVYSFGGNPRSILMWSHYACDHKGCCLQFEVARDLHTLAHAIPVDYSDEYPVVNWITDRDLSARSAILRKHSDWQYENESRMVRLGAARQYVAFAPEALRAIVLGCRVDEATIATLRNLLMERASRDLPMLASYKAAQHDAKYRLVLRTFDLGLLNT